MPCDLVAAIAELLVPKFWNQSVPILEPRSPSSRNCYFPSVGTNASQSWSHGLPVLGASGSQTLEPTLPNFGTVCFRFKKLLTPKDSNQCVPNLELYGPIRGTAGLQRLEPIFPSWNHGFQVPGSAGSQQLRFCLVTWKLRSPLCKNDEFPMVGNYVSEFCNEL